MSVSNQSMNGNEFKITNYLDFRKLLEDYFSHKNKAMKGRFSFRSFAVKSGFKSPNYVRLLINGKRNLSVDGVGRVSKAMGLNANEQDFFHNLVFFNQASDHEEKDFYFRKILTCKDFTEAHKITKDQYVFFARWYHVIIREMVNMGGFKMEAAWLQERMSIKIALQDIEDTLKLLQRLKLIVQDANGRWQLSSRHIEIPGEIASTSLINFHREMLQMAIQGLKQDSVMREYNAMSMSVSLDEFNEVKAKIQEFNKAIQKYLATCKGKPDRVCQLNVQFFHLAIPPHSSQLD